MAITLDRTGTKPEISHIVFFGRSKPVAVLANYARFRQRWHCQEGVIRQMVNGANLNANFGYSYCKVPIVLKNDAGRKHRRKLRSVNACWAKSRKP